MDLKVGDEKVRNWELYFRKKTYRIFDMGMHHFIILNERNILAVFMDKVFDEGRTFCRTAKFECLCCIEEFDGQNALQIIYHFQSLGGCISPLAYMVFLTLRTFDGIDRRRSAKLFILIDYACSGLLWNHKARMQARIYYKEVR